MRFFYKSPFFYLPVIALLLYAAAGLFVPGLLDMTANGDETLYTLINYTGFFSVFAETFIVIPLFLSLSSRCMDFTAICPWCCGSPLFPA